MTEIEAKALALVNADYMMWTSENTTTLLNGFKAMHTRIEVTEARHAAEMRELKGRFGEAVEAYGRLWSKRTPSRDEYTAHFAPFILPAPDPLVEVIRAMALSDATQDDADRLRAAMQARGYEWRKIGEAGE